MKRITFNVPTRCGQRPESGYVAWLTVGTTRHKFVLQMEGNRPSILADYRSGYKVANLAPLALAQYVSNPYAYDDGLSGWRKRAQRTLDDLLSSHSPSGLLQKFASVPTLNP